jgi:hypothetical protein
MFRYNILNTDEASIRVTVESSRIITYDFQITLSA